MHAEPSTPDAARDLPDPAAPPVPAAAETPADRARRARRPHGPGAGLPAIRPGSPVAGPPRVRARRGPAPRQAPAAAPGGGPGLEALAARLNAAHRRIRSHALDALVGCREAGEALIEAKALAGHGRFHAWIDEHCEFGARVAENYIEIARGWAEIEEATRSNTHGCAYLSQAWALKVLKAARARAIPAGTPAEGGAVAAARGPGGDGSSAPADSRVVTPEVIDVEFAEVGPHPSAPPASPEGEHPPAAGPRALVGLPAMATPAASPGGDRPGAMSAGSPPDASAMPAPSPRPGSGEATTEEVLAEVAAHFAAGLARFYCELRSREPGTSRRSLWAKSQYFLRRTAELLTVGDMDRAATCPRCGGRVAEAGEKSCPRCGGLGFVLARPLGGV